MAHSLLDDRSLIPAFTLPGRGGTLLDVADYKRKKNLVLFFLTGPSTDFLIRAEEAAARIRELNAEMIIAVSWSVAAIEAFHKDHRLTFALVSDSGGKVLGRFVSAPPNDPVAALFVTDRYGEIFFQYVVATPADLPPFDDIVNSLVFIESQCPECGGSL